MRFSLVLVAGPDATLASAGATRGTGPSRVTGPGGQLPDAVGGEQPQHDWIHGVLLVAGCLRWLTAVASAAVCPLKTQISPPTAVAPAYRTGTGSRGVARKWVPSVVASTADGLHVTKLL